LASWAIVGVSFQEVNWPAFVAASLVVAFSLTGAGQLLGVLSIAFRNWIAFQSMALGILLVFTGVVIPLSALPGPFQTIARILPITSGLSAVKTTFAGASFMQVSADVLRETVTGLLYFVLAYIGFLVFEHRAKVTGALDRDGL